ncbi:MAG: hypothetical protein JO081_02175 [Alphaproteobacteria bacterium]|nr:hypothetical protein [Alphaproteobacteria bacterium]
MPPVTSIKDTDARLIGNQQLLDFAAITTRFFAIEQTVANASPSVGHAVNPIVTERLTH